MDMYLTKETGVFSPPTEAKRLVLFYAQSPNGENNQASAPCELYSTSRALGLNLLGKDSTHPSVIHSVQYSGLPPGILHALVACVCS